MAPGMHRDVVCLLPESCVIIVGNALASPPLLRDPATPHPATHSSVIACPLAPFCAVRSDEWTVIWGPSRGHALTHRRPPYPYPLPLLILPQAPQRGAVRSDGLSGARVWLVRPFPDHLSAQACCSWRWWQGPERITVGAGNMRPHPAARLPAWRKISACPPPLIYI